MRNYRKSYTFLSEKQVTDSYLFVLQVDISINSRRVKFGMSSTHCLPCQSRTKKSTIAGIYLRVSSRMSLQLFSNWSFPLVRSTRWCRRAPEPPLINEAAVERHFLQRFQWWVRRETRRSRRSIKPQTARF